MDRGDHGAAGRSNEEQEDVGEMGSAGRSNEEQEDVGEMGSAGRSNEEQEDVGEMGSAGRSNEEQEDVGEMGSAGRSNEEQEDVGEMGSAGRSNEEQEDVGEMRSAGRSNEEQEDVGEMRSAGRSNEEQEDVGEMRSTHGQQVAQVAFSASLFASGHGTLGPEPTHTHLVFSSVTTNIGNAYDADTGFFTAPLRGAYHFDFFIAGGAEAGHGSGAVLVKNGQYVVMALEHQTEGFSSTANGATLLLEAGDTVHLLQWANTVVYDNELHHSSFSGHLLFPMNGLIQAGAVPHERPDPSWGCSP
uniref:C1q domain-containing protein n=1 Tax=Knipowitschia caucasica TaxID=637954 RepID=A0AAV2LW11_KNICA